MIFTAAYSYIKIVDFHINWQFYVSIDLSQNIHRHI